MSTALAKWMSLFITINIMLTPILSYLDSLHREAVEVVLTEGAKKAAIEGEFTTAIIEEMKETLVTHYNFNKDDIKIDATVGKVFREEYLEADITVPRTFIFLLAIFGQEPTHFTKTTKIMSEYI